LNTLNSTESFIEVCLKLFKQLSSYRKVVLLNNRHDRPTRVELFASMARDLKFERVITLGDYEAAVNKIFALERSKVLNLGYSTKFKNASAVELLNQIISGIDGNKVLIVGAVNIHTIQAEELLHFFAEQTKVDERSQTDLSPTNSTEVVINV
jgi:gamma-polyglutamate synthase